MSVSPTALGSGWGFPVRVDRASGRLAAAEGAQKVREAIMLVLETEPGERVMRPEFGCGLRRFLAQPNTIAVRAEIAREVENALDAWEPRIEVSAVTVEEGDDPALVEISIAYVHARTRRPDNFVYVFALE